MVFWVSRRCHSELDGTFSSIFSKMTKLSDLQNFFFGQFLIPLSLVFKQKKKILPKKLAILGGLKVGLKLIFSFFRQFHVYRYDKLFNITFSVIAYMTLCNNLVNNHTIRATLSGSKCHSSLLGHYMKYICFL